MTPADLHHRLRQTRRMADILASAGIPYQTYRGWMSSGRYPWDRVRMLVDAGILSEDEGRRLCCP